MQGAYLARDHHQFSSEQIDQYRRSMQHSVNIDFTPLFVHQLLGKTAY